MKTTPNQRLRQFREALNLSPTEMAAALKVSISLIQKSETGHMEVSERMAGQINQAFKLPKEWLLLGKGEMTYSLPSKDNPYENYAIQRLEKEVARWQSEYDDVKAMLKMTIQNLGKLDPINNTALRRIK